MKPRFLLPTSYFLLCCAVALCAGGCGATDTAFRSRVESAEFTAAGTGDKAGNYGGTVGTKITFRDPTARPARTQTRDNK